jgi:hypothetical protein
LEDLALVWQTEGPNTTGNHQEFDEPMVPVQFDEELQNEERDEVMAAGDEDLLNDEMSDRDWQTEDPTTDVGIPRIHRAINEDKRSLAVIH